MLISKTVMVKWNGFTRNWYESKGYIWTKQHELFECNVDDLPLGSTAKVLVECDYKSDGCKGIHSKPYRQYTEDKENGYGNCCTNKKCGALKSKEVWMNMYGVDNFQKLESSKTNLRKQFQKPFTLFIDKANEKNLILLTTENDYRNKKSRIKFICKEHEEFGEQETNAETFLNNKGCCYYGKFDLAGRSNRLDGNIVYQEFINKGLIPKFSPDDYTNNFIPLAYICPNHKEKGVQYKCYANLKLHQHNCYYCGKEATGQKMRLNEKYVFEELLNKGILPIEGQRYKNKDTLIYYRCIKHPNIVQKTTFGGFQNTQQPCDCCRAEESLSNINRSMRSSIGVWKTQSEKNCNYKCIFTGDEKYDIHHLKSYNEIIKQSLNELNLSIKNDYSGEEIFIIRNKVIELHSKYPLGVCISNPIHILFHQLYSKESSIEDFYEFKKRYELGEFKELLEKVS